jgi:release factor glutamine methyltransferase
MFSRIKTLKEAFQNFQTLIQRNYEIEEARSISQIVFKEILGYDTIQLILNENDLLPATIFEQLDYIAFQLNEHKPIQYIMGHTEFYGLKFEVNENVLIPRPETEELVDWIIKDHKDHKDDQSLNILDIGTGSGCIPITLKYNIPQAKVNTIDVSKEAIAIALKNSLKNNVELFIHHQDVLLLGQLDADYDVIVSNPPYVLESEKSEMRRNVLDYEPSLALFVKDNDPLVFYRKIINLIENTSTKATHLYFEINESYADELIKLFDDQKWQKPELRKDIRGKDRMIKAVLIR